MIKIFKNFNKKQLFLIVVSVIFIFIQVFLELKMPDYMSNITKLVQTSGSKMNDILANGFYMLLCAFGSFMVSVFTGYIIAYITSSLSLSLRERLFNKILSFSTSTTKEFEVSSLITRTTNDVTQIEMTLGMGLQLLIKSPITAVWAITKILNRSVLWSSYTAISVCVLMFVVGILVVLVVPRFKIIQKLTDKLNSVTRESLTGIRVVRAFNASNYQEDKFDKVNNDLFKQEIFIQSAFSIMQPIIFLVMYLLTLSIYFSGATIISNSMMSDKLNVFSNMIVFSSYSIQVIMSFLMLAMIFTIIPRAIVSSKRINEVLDKVENNVDGTFIGNTKLKGEVEFRNVSFKYPDAEEYVLKDISFKASKGEVVAFIGSTGSGKSTLINLVPRFYDVFSGEILVDGKNVKEYKKSTLNEKLGYVSQKSVLLNGSVKFNIDFGKNIDIKTIKESIKIAQASEFVEGMDKKYDSIIAPSGTNISGGQKQRLSIARAIAKNPEIYIFDDSFSALDYKTDSILRKELRKNMKNSTVLIVAQRIGTIMNADKIIVLDQGKIVGIGKHKELLKNCNVYKEIALSQLSEEEL